MYSFRLECMASGVLICRSTSTDIDSIKVHKSYKNLEKSDLQCFNLVLIHKS